MNSTSDKILRNYCFLGLLVGFLLPDSSAFLMAQVPVNEAVFDTINKDDLGDVDDQFQETLFLAIAQRAIENYEKAIELLLESPQSDKNSKVINYQLAANYNSLDQPEEAEKYYLKTLAADNTETAVLVELMDLYNRSKSYQKAADIAEKLTKTDPAYNQNLAEFYFLDRKYLEALKTLDKMDQQQLYWKNQDAFRQELLQRASDEAALLTYLEEKVQQNSATISNYRDLIFLYHKTDQDEKTDALVKEMAKLYPDAYDTNLWSYKNHIAQGEKENAVKEMKKALLDQSAPEYIKIRIIEDFREFIAKNPEYENDLIDMLGEEESGGNQTNKQKGEYYLQQDNAKALAYFKKALEETPQDYDLLKNTLLLQVKLKEYEEAVKLAEEALAIYPTQAVLYLYKGMAENGLDNYPAAEDSLLNGIDFVLEDPELENSFYKELVIAYKGLGNAAKAKDYQEKLNKLKNY